MHHIDVGRFESQPAELLVELQGNDFREAVGRVDALGDQHDLVADAPLADPASQQHRAFPPVDVRRVEDVAAAHEVVVEHRRGMRHGVLIVDAHDQSREGFVEMQDTPVGRGRAGVPREGPVGRRQATERLGLLLVVDESDRGAPGVLRLEIAERVVPGHRRRLGLLRAREDGASAGVRLVHVAREVRGNVDDLLVLPLPPDDDPAGHGAAAGRHVGSGQEDVAPAAEDAHDILLGHANAGGDRRHDAAVELQGADRPAVDTGLGMQPAGAGHGHGIGEGPARGGARDEPRDGGRVAADVEDAAAAERVLPEAGFGREARVEGEGGLHDGHIADDLVAEKLHQARRLGMAAVHEGLHEEDPILGRGVQHRLRQVGVDRGRLLDQHMLAGLGGLDGPFGVHRMRRGDVDRLHLGIGQQGFVAAMRADPAPFGGKGVRLRLRPRAHRDQPPRLRPGHAVGKGIGNRSRTQNTPANLFGHKLHP